MEPAGRYNIASNMRKVTSVLRSYQSLLWTPHIPRGLPVATFLASTSWAGFKHRGINRRLQELVWQAGCHRDLADWDSSEFVQCPLRLMALGVADCEAHSPKASNSFSIANLSISARSNVTLVVEISRERYRRDGAARRVSLPEPYAEPHFRPECTTPTKHQRLAITWQLFTPHTVPNIMNIAVPIRVDLPKGLYEIFARSRSIWSS